MNNKQLNATIRMIICLDVSNHITIHTPLPVHRSALQDSIQEISPAPATPLREMLSLEDVLVAFSIEREQLVELIERAMQDDLEALGERCKGLLLVLDNEQTWGTLFLTWGARNEGWQQDVYSVLLETFYQCKNGIS